jgi:hypothetical protein
MYARPDDPQHADPFDSRELSAMSLSPFPGVWPARLSECAELIDKIARTAFSASSKY